MDVTCENWLYRVIETAVRAKLARPEVLADAIEAGVSDGPLLTDEELQACAAFEVSPASFRRVRNGPEPMDVETLGHLNRSLDEIELSVRSYNRLEALGVRTIGDLVKKTEAELLRVEGFGRKSLMEVRDILKDLGLRLGEPRLRM